MVAVNGPREGIWEDVEHDPSFRKQRDYASRVIGLLINTIRCPDDLFTDIRMTPRQIADRVAKEAELLGIITYDDLHHAPMCRANHWHKAKVPIGPCNCGAAAAARRT